MQIEFVLLILSILFFASILAGKAGSRFGVPALLLFLGVGMLFGSDGIGIHFDNIKLAHMIGTVALSAILFSGGLDTKIEDIKPVLGPGITLATLGVLLTAIITGLTLYLLIDPRLGLGVMGCLLLASTMSSTDSASVFSILRGKGLHLKHNLRPTLELESGANDPMAYVLTTTFITLVLQGGEPHYGNALLVLLLQLLIGAVAGWCFGKGLVWIINRINVDNQALYPILVLSGSFFVFAATYYLHGNSYCRLCGGVGGRQQPLCPQAFHTKFFRRCVVDCTTLHVPHVGLARQSVGTACGVGSRADHQFGDDIRLAAFGRICVVVAIPQLYLSRPSACIVGGVAWSGAHHFRHPLPCFGRAA